MLLENQLGFLIQLAERNRLEPSGPIESQAETPDACKEIKNFMLHSSSGLNSPSSHNHSRITGSSINDFRSFLKA